MTPLVTLANPNSADPFLVGTGAFTQLLSSPLNTTIHQPYSCNRSHLSYKKWLMSMSDRAWRQSRTLNNTSGDRELYPTNSVGTGEANELFKLPSVTKAFQVTIPSGRFDAGAGTFVIGLLKFGVHYVFS